MKPIIAFEISSYSAGHILMNDANELKVLEVSYMGLEVIHRNRVQFPLLWTGFFAFHEGGIYNLFLCIHQAIIFSLALISECSKIV